MTIIGDLVLIPIYGFMGPVFASLIAAYAANPLAIRLLRRSGITVTLAPYVKQITLLLLGAALYWWIQPAGFIYRVAILVVFVGLNIVLATITRDDLDLVLPQIVSKRLGALIHGISLKV